MGKSPVSPAAQELSASSSCWVSSSPEGQLKGPGPLVVISHLVVLRNHPGSPLGFLRTLRGLHSSQNNQGMSIKVFYLCLDPMLSTRPGTTQLRFGNCCGTFLGRLPSSLSVLMIAWFGILRKEETVFTLNSILH